MYTKLYVWPVCNIIYNRISPTKIMPKINCFIIVVYVMFSPFEVRRVNDQMMQIERTFLDPATLQPGVELLKRFVFFLILTI